MGHFGQYVHFALPCLSQDSYPNGSIDVTEISTLVPETPDPAHKNMFIIQGRKKGDKKDYPVACDKVEDMFRFVGKMVLSPVRRLELIMCHLHVSQLASRHSSRAIVLSKAHAEHQQSRCGGEAREHQCAVPGDDAHPQSWRAQ